MATKPEWWDEHSGIALMLGLSMPLCIVGAWFSEFRIEPRKIFGFHLISHSPEVMAIAEKTGTDFFVHTGFLPWAVLSKMVFSNPLGLLFFNAISPFRKISIKQELSNNHDEKDVRFNPKTK